MARKPASALPAKNQMLSFGERLPLLSARWNPSSGRPAACVAIGTFHLKRRPISSLGSVYGRLRIRLSCRLSTRHNCRHIDNRQPWSHRDWNRKARLLAIAPFNAGPAQIANRHCGARDLGCTFNGAMVLLFFHREVLPGRSFYVPRSDLAVLISVAVSTLLLLLSAIFAFTGQGHGKWILRIVAPLLLLVGAAGSVGLLGSVNDMTTPACNELPGQA